MHPLPHLNPLRGGEGKWNHPLPLREGRVRTFAPFPMSRHPKVAVRLQVAPRATAGLSSSDWSAVLGVRSNRVGLTATAERGPPASSSVPPAAGLLSMPEGSVPRHCASWISGAVSRKLLPDTAYAARRDVGTRLI